MSLRLHVLEDLGDLAVGSDEEGGAGDAFHFLPVHVLFFNHAVGVRDLLLFIGEERKRQTELLLETLLCLGRVGRNSKDDGAGFFDLLVCVAEPARFNCSTGRVGPREKEEHDIFPTKGFERDVAAILVRQSEFRCFIIDVHDFS